MDKDRMSDYRFKPDRSFEIQDYRTKPLFYSFLPGVAGVHGMPAWAFYTNRGQCICSFGIENKRRSMMEYFSANQAAARVEAQGFRTFVRADGEFYEPFGRGSADNVSMTIYQNRLEILSRNANLGIEAGAVYFTAVDCPYPALIRRLRITNHSKMVCRIEAADGMPQVIPCGISNAQFKAEGNTFCAWADIRSLPTGEVSFGIRQSLEDCAQVDASEGVFYCAAYRQNAPCPIVYDPAAVFGTDASFGYPLAFISRGTGVLRQPQYTVNRIPCAFAVAGQILAPGQSMYLDSVYGYAQDVIAVHQAAKTIGDTLDGIQTKSDKLTEELLLDVQTHTSDPKMDAYIAQCYLDNLLRGGKPYVFTNRRGPLVHYVFGRRHGDLERDYNDFQLRPTYYSQGNGSYRDLCQNRRNDVFFTPEAGLFNIRTFLELIQIDGYNPLSINGSRYRLTETDADKLSERFFANRLPGEIRRMLLGGFDPGDLLFSLECAKDKLAADAADVFAASLFYAEQQMESEFCAGYWSDHFSYNIDLIESYLAVFPDRLNQLLYTEPFRFHITVMRVQPRSKQYTVTPNGVRSYGAVCCAKPDENSGFLTAQDGQVVSVSLYVKLLSLALVKYCTLDPSGVGLEMEAGKPGWNDSLNGLPGLLGSGLPEAIELARILRFLYNAPAGDITLPAEILELACAVDAATGGAADALDNWMRLSAVRDAFREKAWNGLTGDVKCVSTGQLAPQLSRMLQILEAGTGKAERLWGPLIPTYLYHEITGYDSNGDEIHPKSFQAHALPYFLEGPAKRLRSLCTEDAKKLHGLVKQSALWDRELQLFKICENLEAFPEELGRVKAFPRGWLENESVFLHMSYKYLLALLESGAYDEFFSEMKTSFVPFFDAERYGRSILENCSFIASGANPDPALHGRGFVARLSGASAEMLSMWVVLMTGGKPFVMDADTLRFELRPKLPMWMFDQNGEVTFSMLGQTKFCIKNPGRRDTYAPGVSVREYQIVWRDGKTQLLDKVEGPAAHRIRNREAQRVLAYIT